MVPLSNPLSELRVSNASNMITSLNSAQVEAVQSAPETPLQILAGPGSGKTKVLTSRIAHLILHYSTPPSSICAVTFTNKAANEMRERLTKLIGKERVEQVRMGTFHSLCAKFLRIHANLLGLDSNFTICDAEESKRMVAASLKRHKKYLEDNNLTISEGGVLSMISRAKAKGWSAADMLSHGRKSLVGMQGTTSVVAEGTSIDSITAIVYDEYERALRHNNSLDFDDLLLYGVKLFTHHKHTALWCRYLLVDEFQDTNTTQYNLLLSLAVQKHVTVVGDPDQSIYGWRSAEVGNLARMCADFNGTRKILLEQNYRSTGSILRASLAIVSQDKARVQKSLHTLHASGSTPFLRGFHTEHEEALFIATEIKRLIAHMGGAIRWGDIAILLRFNALSRSIESALQKNGIPSKILGGHKFFERQEIKSVLAYLQLIDNPSFNPALVRAANVPTRGIGDKTLQDIAFRGEKSGVSHLSVMEGICDGRLPDLRPTAKRKLTPFVKIIRTMRALADQGTSPADLIRRLIDLVDFETHLRQNYPDWESRWENVKELITFASEVEADVMSAQKNGLDKLNTVDDTPLRLFLQASMLSSDGDSQKHDSDDKVTITTCHAAKGLEWPVVMIPSIEQGTFPFARSDDIEEERRLLYVACTRAQCLLYLSHAEKRNMAGITKERVLSNFISVVVGEDPTLFTKIQPNFLQPDREVICDLLKRPSPDHSEVSRRISEFERMTHHRFDHIPELGCSTTFISSHGLLQNETNDTRTISTDPLRPTKRQLFSVSDSQGVVGNMGLPPATSSPDSRPPEYKFSRRDEITFNHTSQELQLHPLLQQSKTNLKSNNGDILASIRTPPLVAHPIHESKELASNQQTLAAVAQGVKRRLGMGRSGGGYSNKKFKCPT